MRVQDENVDHYNWLASLREPVRELVLKYWDETGRPIVDAPVNGLLIDLCKLHADDGFDPFYEDAKATLVKFDFVKEEQLETYFRLFMAGAIWGTIVVQNMVADAFREGVVTKS